jgi:hypothetical protein
MKTAHFLFVTPANGLDRSARELLKTIEYVFNEPLPTNPMIAISMNRHADEMIDNLIEIQYEDITDKNS